MQTRYGWFRSQVWNVIFVAAYINHCVIRCRHRFSWKWTKHWLLKRCKLSQVNLLSESRVEAGCRYNYRRGNISISITIGNKINKKCDRIYDHTLVLMNGLLLHYTFSQVISAQALRRIIPETCLIFSLYSDDFTYMQGEFLHRSINSKRKLFVQGCTSCKHFIHVRGVWRSLV